MSVRCFYIQPVDRMRLYLRRYRSQHPVDEKPCPLPWGYHHERVYIGESAERKTAAGYIEEVPVEVYQDDPRWPAKCACGYEFSALDPADKDQVFTDSVYRNPDNGEERGLRDWQETPGAMWNAWWLADCCHGADGLCLMVVCPDGASWTIDGRAQNCDSPCARCGRPYHQHAGDCTLPVSSRPCPKGFLDARPHQCWVRQGTPPNLTVGKTGGVTCGAGAGSIQTDKWHGFLREGILAP